MFEIDVPCEVCRPGSDGDLNGLCGVLPGDIVEVREANRPACDRTAVDYPAPVIQKLLALAFGTASVGRMLFTGVFESPDSLVHVPAERADDADIIVVPHVPIGDDIETGKFLLADNGSHRVVILLFIGD